MAAEYRHRDKGKIKMASTKNQPKSASQSEPRRSNGSPIDVLTLPEVASYLRLSESAVLRLVQEQGLPARRVGNEWRFLRAAIQDWLRQPAPPRDEKGAWMALAGAWKDDPYVDAELQAIYRRRGRPMTEDAS
jgi:excisionase family DNA binding protein